MFDHPDFVPSALPADATCAPAPIRPPVPRPPHVDSRRLLGGGRELVIEHAGQHYHLRLTRNDRLILTK
jgi:hemin uptake protein HemP